MCCTTGILPTYLIADIAAHVKENPKLYNNLIEEAMPKKGQPPFKDAREYYKYWKAAMPKEAKQATRDRPTAMSFSADADSDSSAIPATQSCKSEDLLGKKPKPSWHRKADSLFGLYEIAGSGLNEMLAALGYLNPKRFSDLCSRDRKTNTFAAEDAAEYMDPHFDRIFLLDASKRTETQSDIRSESLYPRTLAGIRLRVPDPIAEKAYVAVKRTLDFLSTRLGRDSMDGKGQPIIASLHYPQDNGEHKWSNAHWHPTHQQVRFGDGDGVIYGPYSEDLTVVAHEIFHGMTQHTIGLEYHDQSGALNEHISDVFAILVKNDHLWESPSSILGDDAIWISGDDKIRPEYQRGLSEANEGQFFHGTRSLKDPGNAYNLGPGKRDRQVAHMDQYDPTPMDYGGVHRNSGIPNKAFYLFATSIGNKALKTAGKVWYATITSGNLARDAQFVDFAKETLRHVDPQHKAALKKAWEDVGVLPSERSLDDID